MSDFYPSHNSYGSTYATTGVHFYCTVLSPRVQPRVSDCGTLIYVYYYYDFL